MRADRKDLEDLVAIWRATRDENVASLVVRVSDELVGEAPLLGGKPTWKARLEAFALVAEARDPIDLGRLLAAPWPGDAKTMRALVEIFDAWPDDPRIVVALRKHLAANRIGGKAVIGRALMLCGRLERQPSTAPTDEDLAFVQEVERRYAADIARDREQRDVERGMLDAIYADPDNRGLKAVFGDWLAERDDPRGEFIAIQHAADPTPQAKARERVLIERHGETWAGKIGKFFWPNAHVFIDGFFAGGTLVNGHGVLGSVDDPEWRLVRVLEGTRDEVFGLLRHASGAWVHEVRLVDSYEAFILAAGEPRPAIEVIRFGGSDRDLHPAEPLGTCPALPNLRIIEVRERGSRLERWLRDAPVIDRLERIELGFDNAIDLLPILSARSIPTIVFGKTAKATLSRPFDRIVIDAPSAETAHAVLANVPRSWLREIIVTGSSPGYEPPEKRDRFVQIASTFPRVTRIEVPWANAPIALAAPRLRFVLPIAPDIPPAWRLAGDVIEFTDRPTGDAIHAWFARIAEAVEPGGTGMLFLDGTDGPAPHVYDLNGFGIGIAKLPHAWVALLARRILDVVAFADLDASVRDVPGAALLETPRHLVLRVAETPSEVDDARLERIARAIESRLIRAFVERHHDWKGRAIEALGPRLGALGFKLRHDYYTQLVWEHADGRMRWITLVDPFASPRFVASERRSASDPPIGIHGCSAATEVDLATMLAVVTPAFTATDPEPDLGIDFR